MSDVPSLWSSDDTEAEPSRQASVHPRRPTGRAPRASSYEGDCFAVVIPVSTPERLAPVHDRRGSMPRLM